MRVKAKGPIRDTAPSGRMYNLSDQDQITIPPDDEKYVQDVWVKRGWAMNLDTGEDNEPDRRPVVLQPANPA